MKCDDIIAKLYNLKISRSKRINIEMVLAQLLVLFTSLITASSSYTPNIIIITVDDVGYNDIGFIHKGNGDARTPFLDQYAEVSMVLDNYYVMPNGHSTRSALLTGKHPAHLGTQFEVSDATIPYGLESEHTIIPEYLKKLKYRNHAVGQWDLGFYRQDLLPTNRGYESFYGSYLSYGNYINHKAKDQSDHEGLDLHNNMDIDTSQENRFKTELYGNKAVEIIENHDDQEPLHLYVAFQGAQIDDLSQCKDSADTQQIPNDYYRGLEHVEDPTRKCYLALVKAVDQQYGRIMNTLKNRLMLMNSVVIFTTTSGGPAAGGYDFNAASNSPFRGSKLTGWEGAVRGVAMVFTDRARSGWLTSRCLFHVTDWLPTLVSLYQSVTGLTQPGVLKQQSKLYGKDQFNCVFNQGIEVRESIIHFVYGNSVSYMKFDYKLVTNMDGQLASMDEWYSISPSTSISCGSIGVDCNPLQAACLFAIKIDPCEMRNIGPLSRNDVVIRNMLSDISEFNKTVKYATAIPDERGDPANNGNVWKPWVDSASGSIASSMNSLFSLFMATATILVTQILTYR